VRILGAIAAGAMLGTVSLWGCDIAYADANQEKEACQLMDDPDGHDSGYQPAEYAFMMLRGKMSAEAARNAIALGVQDFCPNHFTDLPASWR
jgi:hypothetical protein